MIQLKLFVLLLLVCFIPLAHFLLSRNIVISPVHNGFPSSCFHNWTIKLPQAKKDEFDLKFFSRIMVSSESISLLLITAQ